MTRQISSRPSDGNGSGSVASVPALEVVQAEKRYEGRRALDGVDLAIATGEFYALIGPNGAGKTTLVRAICRRVALDAGEIRVAGGDPRHSAAIRGAIGLVPQEIALYGDLSVKENLEIFGRLAGVHRSRLAPAVAEALEWTGLAARADERVGTLSGGMKRRLNLAVAMLHRPRLLLLDEPTVGVDPNARQAIHELLLGLKDQGLAVLLTTHDLEQAEELADRIGVLIDGRLRAEGTLDELVGAAFGEAQELTVTLAAVPDDAGRDILEVEGLRPTLDPGTWSGALMGGFEGLAKLGSHLADVGLAVEEFRVREPGLRGVFLRLTGRELSP